jgi:peptide/nickel transport system permease protein
LGNYVLKRLLLFIPTVLAVSMGLFAILRVLPGDVAAVIIQAGDPEVTITEEARLRVTEELGLNRPIYVQYADWIWGVMRFDLGDSFIIRRPVMEFVKLQVPVTLQVAFLSAIMVAIISIPIGVLAAVYQDQWPDYILRSIAVVGLAMPSFFIALLVVLILSRFFHWMPPFGFVHLWQDPWISFQQLLFPALCIGFHSSGSMMRMTRGQMLEVLRDDYIRTARAKGLSEVTVVVKHALRNAMLPVITLFGFQIAFLLGGTVVIEIIFSIPGMGQELIQGVLLRDFPIVQTYVLYIAVIAMFSNLLVDLAYAWLDPRITYS